MIPLSELPDNVQALVMEIQPDSLSPRLVEMGICSGASIRILFRAPFGGPVALQLEASMVSLRLDEARLVLVEIVKEESAR